jgi:hypothetical protein
VTRFALSIAKGPVFRRSDWARCCPTLIPAVPFLRVRGHRLASDPSGVAPFLACRNGTT